MLHEAAALLTKKKKKIVSWHMHVKMTAYRLWPSGRGSISFTSMWAATFYERPFCHLLFTRGQKKKTTAKVSKIKT